MWFLDFGPTAGAALASHMDVDKVTLTLIISISILHTLEFLKLDKDRNTVSDTKQGLILLYS